MSFFNIGLKGVLMGAARMVLNSGYLDPLLDDVSKVTTYAHNKLVECVDYAQVIYLHKKHTGELKAETFQEFFTEYMNGIVAGAIDRNPVNGPMVVQSALELLAQASRSSGAFWGQAVKNFDAFKEAPISKKSVETGRMLADQVKPIIEAMVAQIRADHDQAVAWKNREIQV